MTSTETSQDQEDMAIVARRNADSRLELPKGFRFHPTDEELVLHYLYPKVESEPPSIQIITDLDIYKFDPWNLPEKAVHGETEWYFFSPRDRKYPNGSRPNRAAGSGYWKATGTDKLISCTSEDHQSKVSLNKKKLGVKKALVFYKGKAPNGAKTSWIMHEYRLAENSRGPENSSSSSTRRVYRKGSLRLDDWVLCRIYKKKGKSTPAPVSNRPVRQEQQHPEVVHNHEHNVVDSSSIYTVEDFLASLPEIQESSRLNQLHLLPKLEDNISSPHLRLGMEYDLQSAGSVVLDNSPTGDFEAES